MKRWFTEAFYSFLSICLFACFIGAAIALGILLVPFVILYLFVVVIREMVRWKRKKVKPQHRPSVLVKRQAQVTLVTMPSRRRVA